MAQYGFGLGSVSLLPTTVPYNPIQIGVIKDLSFDISFTNKELRGASQFPVDIARAEGKLSGKVKMAQLYASTIAAVLGVTPTASQTTYGVFNESRTFAAAVVPSGISATKAAVDELGVWHATLGKWMTRVAAAPAVDVSYTFTPGITGTGTYAFHASQTVGTCLLNYTVSDPTASVGYTVSLTNQLMGSGNTFALTAFNTFRNKTYGVKLYAVTLPKLTLSPKQSDYMDVDMDFDAFADVNGKVIDLYTVE